MPRFRQADRRPKLSKREFEHEYLKPLLPVVIPNAERLVWRGDQALTLDWLRDKYGDTRLDELRSGLSAPVPVGEARESLVTLRNFIDALPRAAHRSLAGEDSFLNGGIPYLSSIAIGRTFPGMVEKLRTQTDWMGPNLLRYHPNPGLRLFSIWEAYIGPRSTGFGGLHADMWRTWVVTYQAVGKKTWYIYPPSESQKLYAGSDENGWCHATPFDVGAIESVTEETREHFPLFAEAQGWDVTIETGDLAFIPPSWWHATMHHEPSFACSYRHLTSAQLGSHTAEYLVGMTTMYSAALHRWMVKRRREPLQPR